MPKKRFSKRFSTFEVWSRNAGDTSYGKKVRRRHAMYPSATLSQLKGTPAKNEKPISRMRKVPLSLLPQDVLTPREKRLRSDALEVIDKMRDDGLELSIAARKLKKSPRSMLRHARTALRKRKQDYVAEPSDKIPRSMNIISDGEEVVVIVNSEMATIIGKYHNARKKFLNQGDDEALAQFQGVTVTDIDGNEHVLDTNTQSLLAIEESREEPEFYEIYSE